MTRFASLALVTLALAACQDASVPTSPAAPAATTEAPTRTLAPTAPVLGRGVKHADIPGQYIVILRPGHSASANASAMAANEHGRVRHVYSVINGFALDVADTSALKLARDTKVLAIVPDEVVTAWASGVESSAPWGLDRLDQSTLPLNGSFAYGTDGSGVTVYIVDTGINYSHVDFGGRAMAGYDAVTSGGAAADCNGHGTHVAGTVGGTKYGVAKAASLVGVRVLDCTGNGTSSGVIAGLDWVLKQKQANPSRPMVVNLSLGGGVYAPLDSAVTRLTSAGVTVAVAAGNSTVDACTQSPARVASAITVGATGSNDAFATFSNYGACVDLSAPGVSITSASYASTTGTAVMSGTSMATPHVAGAAALYLSANPAATPAQVATALSANATANVVTAMPAGTPNKLLYVGFLAVAAPANRPPTATITAPTNGTSVAQGATVTFAGSGTDPESGALSGASLVWTSSRDGQLGTGSSFTKTTLSVGTHTITLTARDAQGATGTATRTITVTAPPATTTNQPPVASFTWTCTGLLPHQCAFDASGSTDDVGVASYAWTWGNGTGETKPAATTRKTYAAAGTYTVTLTVADAAGLRSSVSKVVTVP